MLAKEGGEEARTETRTRGPLEGEDAHTATGPAPAAAGGEVRALLPATGERAEEPIVRAIGKRQARAVLTRSAPLQAAAVGVVLLRLSGAC